jgi:hypothetical protein
VDSLVWYRPRSSRSPSAVAEGAPVAEYLERPFQGFFKCVKIGDDVIYNLEFKLPSISEELHLPIDPNTDWGISKIVCQEIVDEERHYQVRWKIRE